MKRALWLIFPVLAGLATGCEPPTRVLLRSPCDGATDAGCPSGAGAVCSTVADGSKCAVDPPRHCLQDLECELGQLCQGEVCTVCDPLAVKGCQNCPAGQTASKRAINGCTVCECEAGCKGDPDCAPLSVCRGGSCVDCNSLSANCNIVCPPGFEPASFLRNKCTTCECVPQNACLKDSDCASGQQCYAGKQCQENCADPSCCHGNLCALPGCKGAPDTSCGLVGCVEGSCTGACSIKPICQCEGEPPQWACKQDPSCPPSACK